MSDTGLLPSIQPGTCKVWFWYSASSPKTARPTAATVRAEIHRLFHLNRALFGYPLIGLLLFPMSLLPLVPLTQASVESVCPWGVLQFCKDFLMLWVIGKSISHHLRNPPLVSDDSVENASHKCFQPWFQSGPGFCPPTVCSKHVLYNYTCKLKLRIHLHQYVYTYAHMHLCIYS